MGPAEGAIGKTASEVVGALAPVLEGYTREQKRVADELSRINGTVRGLCEWRAEVKERFRQEDAHPAEAAPATAPPQPQTQAPEAEGKAKVEVLPLLTLILSWLFRFMLATAAIAGAVNIGKLTELLPK